jgi:peptidoglycan/LPS O-acetylase OafA/YrhL
VDIFFVLSGFLISYILIRECEKYGGRVDFWNFYRGRFIRLFLPMALTATILCFVWHKSDILWALLFLNNIIYRNNTHLWSVAIEFQMYMISPIIILAIYKYTKNTWLIPFGISLVSTIINMVFFSSCPGGEEGDSFWDGDYTCISNY